jgi:DNA repair photolyase
MKALPLPATLTDPAGDPSTQAQSIWELAQRTPPRVLWQARPELLLHPSPLPDQPDVLSLNVATGCGHHCAFCSARASPDFPGDEVVYLDPDFRARLDKELRARAKLPRAVFLSPTTDPFPPVAAVQEETCRAVAVLANQGVECWLMTRGYIRPAALAVLVAHRDRIKVTVSLTTLDRSLQRVLEPLTASPRMRCRQIRRLRRLGIPVQAALDPLVPGLTDSRDNLTAVLEALAEAGVGRVTAGYLFLRPRIRENLAEVLKRHGWDRLVLDAYAEGPILQTGSNTPARFLPKTRRQRGYAALMALAAERGITVSVSALANPDFRTAAPAHTRAESRPRLLPRLAEPTSLARSASKGSC